MATIALTMVGGLAGGAYLPATFLGISGATWGMAAGQLLGSILFAPKGQDVQGPRLSDLKVGSASEGADIPISWGTVPISGQLIWRAPAREHKHTQTTGGKGGPPSSTSTTYSYTCSFAVCFGIPKGGDVKLRRILLNGKPYIDFTGVSASSTYPGMNYTFYDGTQTEPDPLMESFIGINNVSARKGKMYIVFNQLDLTNNFGNSLPTVTIEVAIGGTNTAVKIFEDFIATPATVLPGATFDDIVGHMEYSTFLKGLFIFTTSAYNPYYRVINVIDKYTLASKEIKTTNRDHGLGIHNVYSLISERGSRFKKNYIFGGGYPGYHIIINMETWTQLYNQYNPSFTGLLLLGETEYSILFSSGAGFKMFNKDSLSFSNISMPAAPYNLTSSSYIGCALRDFSEAEANFQRSINPGWTPQPSWLTVVSHATISTQYAVCILKTDSDYYWEVNPLPNNMLPSSNNPVCDRYGHSWLPMRNNNILGNPPVLVECDINGVMLAEYNITDFIGGTNYWPSASGSPVLFYDDESDLITFNLSPNNICVQINVVTKKLNRLYGCYAWGAWCYYDYITDRLFTSAANVKAGDPSLRVYKVNNVTSSNVNVSTIIEDLCEEINISSSLLNISTAETLKGYSHTRKSTARGDIDPLLSYAFCDASSYNWKLNIFPKGGSSVVSIPYSDLGAREPGTKAQSPIKIIEPEAIDLPSSVTLQYVSYDNGLQPAAARADWHVGGERDISVELPVIITDEKAKEVAQKLLQLSYQNRTFKFNFSREYSYLDAGDIITLQDQDSNNIRVKITKITQGVNDIYEVDAVSDNERDLITSIDTGGSAAAMTSVLSNFPVDLFVLDTPLLRDSDYDHPGPYLALNNGGIFNGGSIYDSIDDASFSLVSGMSSIATVGIVQLAPVDIDFEDWDDTNTLRVRWLNTSTLSSISDANVIAGQNAIAYGVPGRWEIINVGSVIPVADNVDDLSHMLRGRRGTNVHCNSHAKADYIVVLDSVSIIRQVLTTSDIGTQRYYRTPLNGVPVSEEESISWTPSYEAYQPYTPINPTYSENTTTRDLTLSCTPRFRRYGSLGGNNSLTDGVGGSDSIVTGYRFQILDYSLAEVTYYDNVTASFDYNIGDQQTDFGSSLPSVRFRVCQLNSLIATPSRWSDIVSIIRTLTYIELINSFSPVVHYRLGDTSGSIMASTSGSLNGTHYNITGYSATSLLDKVTNTSIEYSSTTDYSLANNSGAMSSLYQSNFTVAAWIQISSYPAGSVVSDYNGAYGIVIKRGTHAGIYINYLHKLCVSWWPTGGGIGGQSTQDVPLNEPVFVAFSINKTAGEVKMYMNGVQVGSTYTYTAGQNPQTNSYPWSIGAAVYDNQTAAYGWPMEGVIDEVSFFPSVLSDANLFSIYLVGASYPKIVEALGAVGFWSNDETSGTTATDETGTSNGTYGSGISLAQTAIRAGSDYSVYIDGTTDAESKIDLNFNTQYSAFALECWIKPDLGGPDHSAMLWNKSSYEPTSTSDWPIRVFIGTGGAITVQLSDGGDYSVDASLSGSVTLGDVSHIIINITNNGAIELWINSIRVDNDTIGFALSSSTQNWCFGAPSTSAGAGINTNYLTNTYVDGLVIYDSVLTEEQIVSLYTSGTL